MKSADLVSMVNLGFEKVWLFEVKKFNGKESTENRAQGGSTYPG
jgi:hypothetical protein